MIKDSEVVEEIIRNLGELSNNLGLGLGVGLVYGRIYFYGNKTQDELKQELNLGLSSISQALAVLESFGFIVVKSKNGRKNVYGIGNNNSLIIENMIRFKLEPLSSLFVSRAKMIKDKEVRQKVNEMNSSLLSIAKKMRKAI